MDNDIHRVEAVPRFQPYGDDSSEKAWYQSGRARLFGFVFGVTLIAGLIWTFFQPLVYRSSATVLMSAPRSIDAELSKADVQNVAIQRRILLGSEITQRLSDELDRKTGIRLLANDLWYLLRVEPVSQTNLVEMAAQGAEAEVLPTLVNTWIDVYLDIRSENIEQTKSHTMQVVQGELDELAIKLEEARAALAQFREENDIISVERQENDVLARLDGLNKAMNNAVEAEVKAKSYLEALRESIDRGEKVVPQSQRARVQNMEKELRQLRAQLAELNKRYTIDYINKEPRYRDIPLRIEALEGELAQAYSRGRGLELENATQAYDTAKKTLDNLKQKLEEHKRKVSDFNNMYLTHQALTGDLARLEELNRETQARLVKVEVRKVEKYPQVSVIDRPGPKSIRIGPNYLILLGGTLGASLGLGLLSVWLSGYLGDKKQQPSYITLSGVHMYPQETAGELAYTGRPDPRLDAAQTRLLKGGVDDVSDVDSASGPTDPVDK